MEVSCLLENAFVPYLFLVPDSHKREATTEASLNLTLSNLKSKIESALKCDEKLESELRLVSRVGDLQLGDLRN